MAENSAIFCCPKKFKLVDSGRDQYNVKAPHPEIYITCLVKYLNFAILWKIVPGDPKKVLLFDQVQNAQQIRNFQNSNSFLIANEQT